VNKCLLRKPNAKVRNAGGSQTKAPSVSLKEKKGETVVLLILQFTKYHYFPVIYCLSIENCIIVLYRSSVNLGRSMSVIRKATHSGSWYSDSGIG
jgi:hypothetical protein